MDVKKTKILIFFAIVFVLVFFPVLNYGFTEGLSENGNDEKSNYSEIELFEQKDLESENRVIIKYKEDSPALDLILKDYEKLTEKEKVLIERDLISITLPADRALISALEEYKQRDDIISIEQDYKIKALFVPDDTFYADYQHNMRLIDAEEGWDISYGGDPSIVVAIIDSGVAYEDYVPYVKAADLSSSTFVPGYDFVNDDDHPNDDYNHGTHVCGTVAQTTNNSFGCAGLAFNVSIMPLKVLDQWGGGWSSDVITAIYWAVDNGANVINLSLGDTGAPTYKPEEHAAVQYAKSNNVLVICATGNDNGPVVYPAAYPESIAVGNVDSSKTRYPDSNYGPEIDCVAPGVDILQETIKGGGDYTTGFYNGTGTSMSTPHVAALAALILSEDPNLTYDEVEDLIKNNCEDLGDPGFDNYYGNGLIDVDDSLSIFANNPPVATNLYISPEAPRNSENLKASWDYHDDDGDPQTGSEIRWYKDDALQSEYNDLDIVFAGSTLVSEQWYFTVRPSDGEDFGDLQTSDPVTILNDLSTLWYLPEGYTGAGFETFILMMNPSSTTAAEVTASFMKSDGSVVQESRTIDPNSRDTIKVNDVAGMEDSAFGTMVEVTSGPGIIVERAMYYGSGAHDTMGATQSSTLWYLPEGYTGAGFETFILMMNPSSTTAAEVTASFMKSDGSVVQESRTIDPNSRDTIKVNDVAGMEDSAFGTMVEVTSGPGIIVERAMYYGSGAHDTMGATQSSTLWYLPEGYTGAGFETFILMMNPSSTTAAEVTASFMKSDGSVVQESRTIDPNSRDTIKVNDVAGMEDSAFGTMVEVTSGPGIIVERAMYYGSGAHDTMGATQSSTLWYLPEGYTGAGFETFILMMNPSSTTAAEVTASFMKSDGSVVQESRTIDPNSRDTIKVNDVAGMEDSAFGTMVEVTSGPGIIVERAMYYGSGAHDTMGYAD